jgi:hypothetical protein
MTITLTREEAQQVLDALIWTTGSQDFSETGKARVGAIKVLFPAIETLRARLNEPEPVMCQHKRYVYDDKDQTGHCYDCNQEGRMQFVAYNEATIAKATGEQQ